MKGGIDAAEAKLVSVGLAQARPNDIHSHWFCGLGLSVTITPRGVCTTPSRSHRGAGMHDTKVLP